MVWFFVLCVSVFSYMIKGFGELAPQVFKKRTPISSVGTGKNEIKKGQAINKNSDLIFSNESCKFVIPLYKGKCKSATF